MYTWGAGRSGQLGHGDTTSYSSPKLVEALKDKKIYKIYCCAAQSAAVTSIGLLYHWGWYGKQPSLSPELVFPFNGSVQIEEVSLGGFHVLALGILPDNSKKVYSWGRNEHGQLGLSSSTNTIVEEPSIIESISDQPIVNIFTGEECSGVITGNNYFCFNFTKNLTWRNDFLKAIATLEV